MQVPSILQGESLKRLLQGAAVGAVATIFVGFSWGGWSLGSTADRMAKEQSERAVVAALAPVCADKFRALPDAAAKTIALSKVEAWKRGEEFPKDFVTLPGETYPSSALVYACSTLLLAPKSAALQVKGGEKRAAAVVWPGLPGILRSALFRADRSARERAPGRTASPAAPDAS